jgi:hypothetical protein
MSNHDESIFYDPAKQLKCLKILAKRNMSSSIIMRGFVCIYSFFYFFSIFQGCSTHVPPPRNIDDACVIMHYNENWKESLQSAEAQWQVPIELILSIIRNESSFRAQIRPPMRYTLGFIPRGRRSSAYGYAQVIDGTWTWYQRATGHWDHHRDQFSDAVNFIAWYIDQTYQRYHIEKVSFYLHYLAYHEGHGGFKRKSYLHKKKLLKYAKKVEQWAEKFQLDLADCELLWHQEAR